PGGGPRPGAARALPRRYSDLDRLSCRHDSFPPAIGARGSHLTRAPASPALIHAAGEAARYLAATLAARAGDLLAALFASRPTGRADFVVLNLESLGRAVNRVLERYSQRILDVGAPLRLHPGCSLAANPAE